MLKPHPLSLTSAGSCGGPPLHTMERMGRRKAAVFPEPVWAHAIKSLLAIMMGRAYFWTGVGLWYLADCRDRGAGWGVGSTAINHAITSES